MLGAVAREAQQGQGLGEVVKVAAGFAVVVPIAVKVSAAPLALAASQVISHLA